MKINRTRNTIKGSVWRIIERVANMLFPFVVRTVIIYKLGIEYLGLNSLFTSILQVLNITELGFASATVYSMYKPIADDDYKAVGAILYYLKKIYANIGIAMLGIGGLFIPFLKYAVNGAVPADINLYVLYIIFLLNSSISYFFMGYKSVLLNALQHNDIISKVDFGTNCCLKLAQYILLFFVPNYYIFVVLMIFFTIANNIIKAYIVDKRFQKYLVVEPISEELKKDIKSKIFPLVSTKLATVLLNSVDTLVISAFLGLTETAMYNNYYFVMTSVQSLIFVIHSSMLGGVGNSLVIDTKEHILKNFRKLNFINGWLITICCSCFLCVYQPFMEMWVGESYMLSYIMVIMFTLYFYSGSILRVTVVYKDASGIWKQDMLRTYLSCIVNIALNVVSVQYMGLYGVIGSSVFVGLLIDPWIAKTLYKYVFDESPVEFYIRLMKNFLITFVIGVFSLFVCRYIAYGLVGIVLRILVCFCVSNTMLFFIYIKDDDFLELKRWIIFKFPKGIMDRLNFH